MIIASDYPWSAEPTPRQAVLNTGMLENTAGPLYRIHP